jgi:hypothetical protein
MEARELAFDRMTQRFVLGHIQENRVVRYLRIGGVWGGYLERIVERNVSSAFSKDSIPERLTLGDLGNEEDAKILSAQLFYKLLEIKGSEYGLNLMVDGDHPFTPALINTMWVVVIDLHL